MKKYKMNTFVSLKIVELDQNTFDLNKLNRILLTYKYIIIVNAHFLLSFYILEV